MGSPTELLPCPFCGGKAKLIASIKPWVSCTNNDCPSKEMQVWKPGDQKKRAIKAWNTRTIIKKETMQLPNPEDSGQCSSRLGVDASKWAKEFMRLQKKVGFSIDEGLMRGWFANAIMAGMDEQYNRCRAQMELSEQIRNLIEREKILARIDEISCSTIYSLAAREKRAAELKQQLEAIK